MSRPWLVVGEALVDIFVADGQVGQQPTLAVGGSPANVAVGLARLGVPTLLLTRVGDDALGHRVVKHLSASGVELHPASIRSGDRTSTATARLGADHSVDYDFDLRWELEPTTLPKSAGMHVGSLGTSLQPGRAAVVDLVGQAADADLLVSYDPNLRPAFLDDPDRAWRDLTEVAAASTLVKVSADDLGLVRPGEPTAESAARLLEGERTELVIVTKAEAGAEAFTDGTRVSVPAATVQVVDTVGAGDSFMAAALTILWDWQLPSRVPGGLAALDSDRVRTLLAGAVSAAAVTCSRRGANPPARRELPATWPA